MISTPEISPDITSRIWPGLKNPKMSPYANRNSIAIHEAEILRRTPILSSAKVLELDMDTPASLRMRCASLVTALLPAMMRRARAVKERTMERPRSVQAYFRSLPPEQRPPLQKLRETIAAAAPEAEEGITYSMPGFLLDGRGFVSYAAFNDHYSFFPMGSEAIEVHRTELGARVTGKGTIRFEYGERLPTVLVKKVVRTRLAQATGKRAAKRT